VAAGMAGGGLNRTKRASGSSRSSARDSQQHSSFENGVYRRYTPRVARCFLPFPPPPPPFDPSGFYRKIARVQPDECRLPSLHRRPHPISSSGTHCRVKWKLPTRAHRSLAISTKCGGSVRSIDLRRYRSGEESREMRKMINENCGSDPRYCRTIARLSPWRDDK